MVENRIQDSRKTYATLVKLSSHNLERGGIVVGGPCVQHNRIDFRRRFGGAFRRDNVDEMIDHWDGWFGFLIILHGNRKRFGGDVVRSVDYGYRKFAIKFLNDRPGRIRWQVADVFVNQSSVPDCVKLGEFKGITLLFDAIATGIGVAGAVERLVDVSQKMNEEPKLFRRRERAQLLLGLEVLGDVADFLRDTCSLRTALADVRWAFKRVRYRRSATAPSRPFHQACYPAR
jgi:hypothetical protein